MEHGEKTLKKVSIAEENLACYTWRISADTITSSSHQWNKATNSYQPSLQLWYNFWCLCREPIAHTSHNLHATLIGMLHYNGVCLKTNRWRPIKFNLIISRSKPSGNSHTAESAMHLSCCWSRRAPRKHIAAYKQQNVMTTIQMNHNEVLIELTVKIKPPLLDWDGIFFSDSVLFVDHLWSMGNQSPDPKIGKKHLFSMNQWRSYFTIL